MHPFLLDQPASAAAATPAAAAAAAAAAAHAEQENKMSGVVENDGGAVETKQNGAFSPAAAAAAAANANSLDIAALALTPRSEAAAKAARASSAQLAQPVAATATATAAAAAAAAAPAPLPPPRKVKLRIEARLRADHPAAASAPLRRDLERQLALLLRDRSWVYRDCPAVPLPAGASPELLAAVETCAVVDTELDEGGEAGGVAGGAPRCPPGTVLLFWQVELSVTCYAVSSEPAAVPPSLGDGDEAGGGAGNGAPPPYKELVLPHASLEGSLDALSLPRGAKARVLRRLGAALALGGAGVDPRLVPSGRLALLVGPPGTGKTSLCRAAAQRLAIRLCCGPGNPASRFPGGALLLEVSAPALFSKWFSESGRAVARLFERVAALANEERALVFVLIDEVESLAGSRTGGGGGGGSGSSSSSSGGDPGDAMRAVNALLTGAIGKSFLVFAPVRGCFSRSRSRVFFPLKKLKKMKKSKKTGLDALRDSAPGTCVLCTSNLGG